MFGAEVTRETAVRAVLGGNRSVCRLCLRGLTRGLVRLSDDVVLGRGYCPPAALLADILAAVYLPPASSEEDNLRSDSLCLVCARAAIDAYVFQKYCQHAELAWCSARRALAGLPPLPDHPTHSRSLFLLLQGGEGKVLGGAGGENRVESTKCAARRATSLARRERRRRERRAASAAREALACAECGRLFARAHLLRRHAAAHAHADRLACADCGRICASRFKLQVHRDRAHGDKTHKCDECSRRFASAFLAEEHRRAMHVHGSCRVCGKLYSSRKGLRDHETAHAFQFACACGKLYRYREGLRVHASRCAVASPAAAAASPHYVCHHCDKRYAFKHTLQQHIRFAHSDRPLACAHCNKKFLSDGALRNHLAVHTGRKNYTCALCGGAFMSSTTLANHTRARHTGERPYPCDACGETFITSFRRTEHARRRHGAPGPTCVACCPPRTFTTVACLKRHARCHLPALPP